MKIAVAGHRRAVLLLGIVAIAACQPAAPKPSAQAPKSTAGQPTETLDTADSTEAGAVAVVRAHYQAIDQRRYRDAYELWESKGAASGKTFEAFQSGFASTKSVTVEAERPAGMEGAAGSRYVQVPVHVIAKMDDGTTQEFKGTYTVRRAVVDGATLEQRAWHLYSADVHRVVSMTL